MYLNYYIYLLYNMDIIYNSCSYFRILSIKSLDFLKKCITGNYNTPVERQIQLPVKKSIYNHILNIFLYPTNIIDNIYLGNGYNASNYSVVRDYNIKYIVNVTKEIPNYYEYNIVSINNTSCAPSNLDIKYFNIPILDNDEGHISVNISNVLNFIEEAQSKNDGNILIHCYMGSSRSASVVLAYLIYKYNFTLNNALKYIKKKRDIVNININFINDIKDFFNLDDE
jgi:protein-tyrosine phosphatase